MKSSRMKTLSLLLTAGFLAIQGLLSGAEEKPMTNPLPEIRKAASPPFVNGKRVEAQWANADILTGFVIPGKASISTNQTEASMLYDNENLYLSLKAFFNPILKAKTMDRSLFADNNFEIFILPSPGSGTYYQVAVSEHNQLYMGHERTKRDIPGVKTSIEKGKDFWIANVTIPLKSMQISPSAGKDMKIRFNIARMDIDTADGKPEESSFAVLDGSNYHLPDLFAEAVITDKSGVKRRIPAHSSQIRINLFVNPEFDYAINKQPIGWSFMGKEVTYQETMAMSGEWIVSATGGSYHFMSGGARDLKAGQDYTMRVKARKFGDEGKFGIVQMVRKADGRVGEGNYLAFGIPLTNEFHEYYLPMKCAEDFTSFAFYRIGSKTRASGIEIAAIHLFEGKISSFEIRKVNRSGIKKLIPGTTPEIPANLYGRRKDNLKVLVLAGSLMSTREALEIFSGLNAEVDILTTTGKNADVYYTDNEPKEIRRRLADGTYDLYMIGSNIPDNIGKELAGLIMKNVENGAGLFLNRAKNGYGNFKDFLRKYPPATVPEKHYLRNALPIELFILPEARQDWTTDSLQRIREAGTPKGRIVVVETAYGNNLFKLGQNHSAYSNLQFPAGACFDAWLARILYYTAKRTSSTIDSFSREGAALAVHSSGMPDGAVCVWTLLDKNGKKVAGGETVFKENKALLSLPALKLFGRHAVLVWAKDKSGAVIDYTGKVINHNGPEIQALKDVKTFYRGRDKGEFEAEVKGVLPGMKLEWTLEDFAGRILEKGTLTAAEKVHFQVPLEHVYTNLARLEVSLKQGDDTLDARKIPFYIQDRDQKRLLNDFTPSLWNGDGSMDSLPIFDRQLEKIGFRCYLLPLQGGEAVLNAGMGLGAMFLGGGDTFCGWKQTTHIRAQQINTAAARKYIAANAEKRAADQRIFGTVHSSLSDEPNLCRPGSEDELDAHPENIAEYRNRMKAKYGTIENYNHRMQTSRKSFDELDQTLIRDARATGKFGEFIEWRAFNADRWCEIIKIVSDNGKKGDPNTALSLYNSFGQGALGGNDYWKLLTKAGLDFSQEYTSMVYMGSSPIYDFDEFYRSFRPDMRVWGFTGYYFSREKSLFQPWWFALHRYGGFTWFAATSGAGAGGGGAWLNMLDVPSYGFTEDAENTREGLDRSQLLNGLGKLFLEYDWAKRDVAVFYSHPSMMVSFCLGKETKEGEIHASGKLYDYFQSRFNLHHMLEELLYQYDFVASEQIQNGKLNSYKTIFLPGILALEEKDIQALKEFAAKGGVIITDFQPGVYDELGVKRTALPFRDLPKDKLVVLGKLFNDKDMNQRKQILDLLAKAGSKPVIACENAVSFTGREAMRFVKGNMNVYAVLRNFTRAKDDAEQTFTFPNKGHIYDLRNGKYLGLTDTVQCRIVNGEAAVFGHYPYKINAVKVSLPSSVKAGSDLTAAIRIEASAAPETHVFHVEVIPPNGEARFFMTRNVTAENGKYDFVFRMAANDPAGKWTLRVKDILSGITVEKNFTLTAVQ